MKKITSIMIATGLMLSLTGCVISEPSLPSEETKAKQQEQQKEEEQQKEAQEQQKEEEMKEEQKNSEGLEKLANLLNDPKNAQKKKIYDAYLGFLKNRQYVGDFNEHQYGSASGEILDYSYTFVKMNDKKDQMYMMLGIYTKWFNATEFRLYTFDEGSGKIQKVQGDKGTLITKLLSTGEYTDAVGIVKSKPGLYAKHRDKASNYVTAEGNQAKVEDIKQIPEDINYDIELCDANETRFLNKFIFDIDASEKINTEDKTEPVEGPVTTTETQH